MMESDVNSLMSLLSIPAAAGAAYGAVKAGLNGAKESLAQIERTVNRIGTKVDTHGERLASVEAETANLKERLSGRNN